MTRDESLEFGGVVIGFVTFWAAIFFFLVDRWLAFGWLVFWVVAGLLVYAWCQRPTPRDCSLEDIRELERQQGFAEALKCKGRVPHDADYQKAGRSL